MIIDYNKTFIKQLKKSPSKIKIQVFEELQLFQDDPFHTSLNNHTLKEKYSGYRSINITEDWRAVYYPTSPDHALFVALGTHNQLYKR
jgi:addiction module RelE/StbE family toxin